MSASANRSARRSLASNPVLIGATTTLVVLIAVFLAYNANNGLPFVPTYAVDAMVEDAAELVPGNEVRVGGSRVGVVTDVLPEVRAGRYTARLKLKLEQRLEPLPADTVVSIRQRSNLGLKYVELDLGRSGRTIAAGATLPLSQSRGVVDLDDVLNAVDEPTSKALQNVVAELGAGLAGRGGDLNATIGELPGLLGNVSRVSRNLAGEPTALAAFIRGADAAARTLEPVAPRLGDLAAAGATTFRALDRERPAVDRTLVLAAPTLRETRVALGRVRPLLRETAATLQDVRPAARRLPVAARALTAALRTTGPVLQRSAPTADALDRTLVGLRRFATDPSVALALGSLTRISADTTPILREFNPMQVRCNYLGLWGRNVSSVISEGDPMGTWFRFTAISRTPEILQRATPSPELHVNPLPDSGQRGECEPGNSTFVPGRQTFGSPGTQPGSNPLTAPGTIAEMVAAERRARR